MKYVVSHYQSDYEWVKEYTDDFLVYSKDEKNVGYNIYDILTYIIDHYDDLQPIVAFVKDNLLSRHITKEEFDEIIFGWEERMEAGGIENSGQVELYRYEKELGFTPILTQHHEEKPGISYYKDGIYHEINDSWYLREIPAKYFKSYNHFADTMGLPKPDYIPFAPGANYIVPKENILQHPKSFYEKLLSFVDYTQLPGEAHIIERALYTIWKL